MEFLDTPVNEMTIRDQLKLGLLLTGVTVGLGVLVTVAAGAVAIVAEKVEERRNNEDDNKE